MSFIGYFFFLRKSVANLKIRLAIRRMKMPIPNVTLEIFPEKFREISEIPTTM